MSKIWRCLPATKWTSLRFTEAAPVLRPRGKRFRSASHFVSDPIFETLRPFGAGSAVSGVPRRRLGFCLRRYCLAQPSPSSVWQRPPASPATRWRPRPAVRPGVSGAFKTARRGSDFPRKEIDRRIQGPPSLRPVAGRAVPATKRRPARSWLSSSAAVEETRKPVLPPVCDERLRSQAKRPTPRWPRSTRDGNGRGGIQWKRPSLALLLARRWPGGQGRQDPPRAGLAGNCCARPPCLPPISSGTFTRARKAVQPSASPPSSTRNDPFDLLGKHPAGRLSRWLRRPSFTTEARPDHHAGGPLPFRPKITRKSPIASASRKTGPHAGAEGCHEGHDGSLWPRPSCRFPPNETRSC